mmetsp:Transcript_20376/g.33494  ORF Transcript_20376/g.33494 Transcript_20376/m.33494 type:complete len:210 (-) Transcript_20376:153-782(-)|eukprot:jgi/Bigna1/88826/estExt_fgenesh1_pg.C_390009
MEDEPPPMEPKPTTKMVGRGDVQEPPRKATQIKEVADSTLQFLHFEIIEYCRRTCKGNTSKAIAKMDEMGVQVGARLAERYTSALVRLSQQLDTIKFICKEFWISTFKKQADKLQTNYLGIYVVHDYKFPWFTRLSNTKDEVKEAQALAALATGIIKGALENMGMKAKVTCELTTLPRCSFTIVDKKTLPGTGVSAVGNKKGAATSNPK